MLSIRTCIQSGRCLATIFHPRCSWICIWLSICLCACPSIHFDRHCSRVLCSIGTPSNRYRVQASWRTAVSRWGLRTSCAAACTLQQARAENRDGKYPSQQLTAVLLDDSYCAKQHSGNQQREYQHGTGITPRGRGKLGGRSRSRSYGKRGAANIIHHR